MEDLYNKERKHFLTFLSRTTQKKKTVDHLQTFLPLYSHQTIRALTEKEKRKRVRFLDIGAGTGKLILSFLSSFNNSVEYTAREPNIGMAVNLFYNYLVEDLPFQNLKIDPRLSTDYGKERYDFVLASHSFYYLPDWEEAVKAVYDSLVPGGAACIIMGSEKSDLTQLRTLFFPKIHGIKPRTIESLIEILNKTDIRYYQDTISSLINTEPSISDIKALRENGILKPDLDSLYSFLLWYNFNELSIDMQKEVKLFINQKSRLELIDSAVWILKPGNYSGWEDIDNSLDTVTVADFVKLFKPMLEDKFGRDIIALTPGLKEAYFSILCLDSYLTHPLGKVSLLYEKNTLITQDDEQTPYPIPGNGISDFILIDPHFKFRLKDSPMYDDNFYILLYTHGYDSLAYLINYIHQEYDFLPEEDKKLFSKEDYIKIIYNLFDVFRHNQIFSNRYEGSTILGNFIGSEYFNRNKLKSIENITPSFAEFLKESELIVVQPSPIKD